MTECLEEANKHKMTKTLAFPTLGTGSLNYPPDQVAQVMADCIKDFDQRYQNKKLKRIIIVVYNQDKKWKTVEQVSFHQVITYGGCTLVYKGLNDPSLFRTFDNSHQFFVFFALQVDQAILIFTSNYVTSYW